MARPREFDIDDAVHKAMTVFWEKGYEGASLPDLLDGMGIARGSLYKAFGDKKRLFMKALARYDQEVVAPAIDHLTQGRAGHGHARLLDLFDQIISAARQGDRRGCFLCNVAAGPASTDEEIGTAIAAMVERLTRAFSFALGDAPSTGLLNPDQRMMRARALVAAYVGLRVLSKAGEPVPALQDCVSAALQAYCPDCARSA